MRHIQKDYADFLNARGFTLPELQYKAVFIADSYGLIAEIVRKSLQTKKQRQYQYETNGYVRTRGAIVESTFGFASRDLYFLVNDGDYSCLINRIASLLDYDRARFLRLDQQYCGCCVLQEGSFQKYETAYELLVSENSRGKSFMDTKIFLEDTQILYIIYIRDRYMSQERRARLNDLSVLRIEENLISLG